MKRYNQFIGLLLLFIFPATLCKAQTWEQFNGNAKSSNYFSQKSKNGEMSSRYNHAGLSIDNDIYIFGGWGLNQTGACKILNDLWHLNVLENKWECLFENVGTNNNTPSARSNSAMFYFDKKIYIMQGLGYDLGEKQETLGDCWTFDIESKKFENILFKQSENESPVHRYGALTWQNGSKVYFFGGFSIKSNSKVDKLNDFWMFDLMLKKWILIDKNSTGSEIEDWSMSVRKETDNFKPRYDKDAATWMINERLYMYHSFNDNVHLQNAQVVYYDLGLKKWVIELNTLNNVNNDGEVTNPGFRKNAVTWIDNFNLYLYGGYSYDSRLFYGMMDDTWTLDLLTKKWAKLAGNKMNEVYSSMDGTSPGSRIGSVSLVVGNFNYLIGGIVSDKNRLTYRNDIWRMITPKKEKISSNLVNPIYLDNSVSRFNTTNSICEFSIVPNPVFDKCKAIPENDLSNIDILVLNELGKLVLQIKLNQVYRNQGIDLDVSTFQAGKYFVTFLQNNVKICSSTLVINKDIK
jgi:N-acetylneuraminic acid mutarotase